MAVETQNKKPSLRGWALWQRELSKSYWVIDCDEWLPWGTVMTAVGAETDG
jgi:hypothetical protein